MRQDEARQTKTRRHPDKKVSPGFEKYCTYKLCINEYVVADTLGESL